MRKLGCLVAYTRPRHSLIAIRTRPTTVNRVALATKSLTMMGGPHQWNAKVKNGWPN
jgi:hypothetical protein